MEELPGRVVHKALKERRAASGWSGMGGFREVLGIHFYFRDLTAQRKHIFEKEVSLEGLHPS